MGSHRVGMLQLICAFFLVMRVGKPALAAVLRPIPAVPQNQTFPRVRSPALNAPPTTEAPAVVRSARRPAHRVGAI